MRRTDMRARSGGPLAPRFGVGQIEGSNCTPLGLHCIAEKIGEGQPPGTVFKSREVIGHTSEPKFADAKITTRIMWLEGLEPGFNQGTDVDSHSRYIYIHGTGDQDSIGEPASHGCIHLADDDLLWLFDKVPPGTLVLPDTLVLGDTLVLPADQTDSTSWRSTSLSC